MNKILGILNLYNSPSLGKLTKNRPLGATTFLGRYAIMDFALSNFTNSGINRIDILIEEKVQSIKNHIKDGYDWINNTRTGFLKEYFNEEKINTRENTDINNILKNGIVEKDNSDLVLVSSSKFVLSLDFRPYIEAFLSSNADMACLYVSSSNAGKSFAGCDKLKILGNYVTLVSKVKTNEKKCDVSLDIYIFKKDVFDKLVHSGRRNDKECTFRKLFVNGAKKKTFKVLAQKFEGYVAPILSFDQYIEESMKLLNYENRKQLCKEDWTIYTTLHNAPPATYGPNANVRNSFVANGAVIKGDVTNSIISRDVRIDEGAVVKNCILFTGSHVHKGIKLENVVCDKKAKFVSKNIKGTKSRFEFVPFGDRK